MKILLRDDFKYVVELPCPHDGPGVRKWCAANKIPFVYYSSGAHRQSADPTKFATMMAYAMTEESHAAWFKLRWL